MSDSLVTQVVERLAGLPDTLQQRVLEFVEALSGSAHRGVPGQQLLRFVRAFPADTLQGMRDAIELGCEQVDAQEW